MKFIEHILNEIFDFFCGDWRIFWGIVITVCLIHINTFSDVRWFSGVIFIIGITLSLIFALKREIPKKQ